MGNTSYNFDARVSRASLMNYATKSADQIFTQKKEGKINEGMNPKGLNKRECFDSETHPNTIAILLGLDHTGSMGRVPLELVRDGLPHLMSGLIGKGLTDAAVCFVPVGDHYYDKYPLQVAQFESGDEELDHWLTKSILEGGGGANGGESYMLTWLVAARHTNIDCFTKRGKKGYCITVGDEPCHPILEGAVINQILGTPAEDMTTEKLLAEAQKMYHVYHIHLGNEGLREWQSRLGENCIHINHNDHEKVPGLIIDLIMRREAAHVPLTSPKKETPKETEVIDGKVTTTEEEETQQGDTKPPIML